MGVERVPKFGRSDRFDGDAHEEGAYRAGGRTEGKYHGDDPINVVLSPFANAIGLLPIFCERQMPFVVPLPPKGVVVVAPSADGEDQKAHAGDDHEDLVEDVGDAAAEGIRPRAPSDIPNDHE